MLAVPHQIIDYTLGRNATFHDNGGTPVVTHVDFTEPYDQEPAAVCSATAAGRAEE